MHIADQAGLIGDQPHFPARLQNQRSQHVGTAGDSCVGMAVWSVTDVVASVSAKGTAARTARLVSIDNRLAWALLRWKTLQVAAYSAAWAGMTAPNPTAQHICVVILSGQELCPKANLRLRPRDGSAR
jgi:hypothetical protein